MITYLEEKINQIIKRWRDKQFRKKILEYKSKLNEKKKSRKTK
jgi:hypothetical protein